MVTKLTAQGCSGGWDETGTGTFQGMKAVQSSYVTRGIVTIFSCCQEIIMTGLTGVTNRSRTEVAHESSVDTNEPGAVKY
jgi:hypothetical protein